VDRLYLAAGVAADRNLMAVEVKTSPSFGSWRFLVNRPVERTPSPITVALHWTAGLKR
jgi:hypothetical protein